MLLKLPLTSVDGAFVVAERVSEQALGGDEQAMELVARLRAGDRDALASVYEAHHAAVRGFARRMVGDIAVAEDLVHEAFMALPKAVRRFRGEATLRSFILSVALNCARHYVRAAARRRKAMDRLAKHNEHNEMEGASPAQALAQQQLANQLWRALDALSLDHRAVFVLSEVEQRSSAEVAALTGTSEGTVRSRLFYAKRKLRELLNDAAAERGEGL